MQNEARIYSKSLEGDKQLTSSFKVMMGVTLF